LRQAGGWNNNIEWIWNLGWRRSLIDWEKHLKQELAMMLDTKSIFEEKKDKWVWKVSVATEFTVQSAYKVLRGEGQEEEVAMYEEFWRIKAQPSVQLTTWRMLEDKIASKRNLVKRGDKRGKQCM